MKFEFYEFILELSCFSFFMQHYVPTLHELLAVRKLSLLKMHKRNFSPRSLSSLALISL